MSELVNVIEERFNNKVEPLNKNNNMEEVRKTSAEAKMQAVEEARQNLIKAKNVLEANKDAEANIKKSAQVNVGKAETAYLEALKKVELPTAKVELWNETKNTKKQVVFTKEEREIIIATSVYNMAVSKVNIECGKDLITNEHFNKVSLYITEATLIYNADIELKDLNGNIVPKGTPNVYVPIDKANGYWQWASYHEHNLNAIVKDDTKLIIENVRIKEFTSLQEFGKYRGVNNVLSRGFNGLEKAGNAALATQNEFYQKIFKVATDLRANVSVVTKYYNHGKLLGGKVWNSAMLGVIVDNLQYDLSVGDNIIKTLQDKHFKDKTIKERYMIDAISQLVSYTPQGAAEKIGIDGTLKVIQSLSKEDIKYLEAVSSDKVNEIYSVLLTKYLKLQGIIKDREATNDNTENMSHVEAEEVR